MEEIIKDQIYRVCRRLMSELNRDASSPGYGCFDRRFWAWKLVDFPEATFQRNTHALGWFLQQPENEPAKGQLVEAVRSGLIYAARIQHRDGSFDQAFPFERSFGATGFLLADLAVAYQSIEPMLGSADKDKIIKMLFQAGSFLARHHEGHGFISNHLAGAALGLILTSRIAGVPDFEKNAEQLVGLIIKKQSPEGWFEEYGGADPGYQTLCMYYLAQIDSLIEMNALKNSLQKSLEFLQFFIQPDGTFGGEYGSRRTEIYYPGGIALLASQNPIAARMHQVMAQSLCRGTTVTLADMDMGNTAPLLMNMILAHTAKTAPETDYRLPFEQDQLEHIFPAAGIAIRSQNGFWAVLGASNGGTIRVYDKPASQMVYEDCGIRGETNNGRRITSQVTDLGNALIADNKKMTCETGMYFMSSSQPNPLNFLFLRFANLTLMRIPLLNEWLKKIMVGMLITRRKKAPLTIKRTLEFNQNAVKLTDSIKATGKIQLQQLTRGGKFVSIHMASARYFTPARQDPEWVNQLDVQELNTHGKLTAVRKVSLGNMKGRKSE